VKYELNLDQSANVGVGGFALPDLATSILHRDYRIEISDQYVLSPDIFNTFRIALGANDQRIASARDAPMITVQGAFSEGGAQLNEWRKEPRTDIQDTVSYSKGPTTLKFGAVANFIPFRLITPTTLGEHTLSRPLPTMRQTNQLCSHWRRATPCCHFNKTITHGSRNTRDG
jgi:hypothetical protein